MTKLGAAIERERPDWYGELSRPPFRTFKEGGIDAMILATARRNDYRKQESWIKRKMTIASLILVLAASILLLYPLLQLIVPHPAGSPSQLSESWQTYQGEDYSFLLPNEWESFPGKDGSLVFTHHGQKTGNMAIQQYGFVYSSLMDRIYPDNATIVSKSIIGNNAQLPAYYYFRFEITEANGGTRLEDHYYIMQASITYDFYFPSLSVDKNISEKIVKSFSPAL
ncbi:hypothetical protein [Cohnella mopanensis]|uniref:hypothetical protein n=1 Tax=Cohnella mopanensis TaxID=2911966 RepID=UPI001EF7A22E|nr:hypothetical protein [Cohnella mopanensis]